jgi:acyl carrier protein
MFRNSVGREFVAPESELEKSIAAVWQELLGIDAVSVTDNFFELGGHSLLSMKASYQIEDAAGVRLNARDMLLLTLGQLAALSDRQIKEMEAHAAPDAPTMEESTSLFSRLKELIARN